MVAFLILSNFALPFVVGVGIHSFSGSIFWAILGALFVTGSASTNIFFALVAYPLVEIIFSDSGLTVYSAIYLGITLSQLAIVILLASRSEGFEGSLSTKSTIFSKREDL